MALDPTVTPEGVVHLSYYAMFHSAAAILLERKGSAPKTHSATIGQFGELARAAGAEAERLGRLFNRAEDKRLIADYSDTPAVAGEDAAAMREDAIEFVALCRRWLEES
jgi:uncharacterized protein (UPF0332 family)